MTFCKFLKLNFKDCFYWFETAEHQAVHDINHKCHSNQLLNGSFDLSDRLDEIFDMGIMNADYGYQFSGKYSNQVKGAVRGPKNDIISLYHESFWKECPVEGQCLK